jgi:hypothetical protein
MEPNLPTGIVSEICSQTRKKGILDDPDKSSDDDPAVARTAYHRAQNESTEINCFMLTHMELDLQRQFEDIEVHDMIMAHSRACLRLARAERYNVYWALPGFKLMGGEPLSPHVIKMVGHITYILYLVVTNLPKATKIFLGELVKNLN